MRRKKEESRLVKPTPKKFKFKSSNKVDRNVAFPCHAVAEKHHATHTESGLCLR